MRWRLSGIGGNCTSWINHEVILLVLGILAAGFFGALRPWFPLGLWLFIPGALVLYKLEIIRETSPWGKKHLAAATLTALGGSLLVCTSSGLHNPETYPHSLDDATYHAQAQAIADVWRRGEYPPLSAKGSALFYIGSLHTGYQRLLAALYYLLGADFRWGILANFVAVALIPLFVYRAVLVISQSREANSAGPLGVSGERNAVAGAWLAAFYPSFGYWASWLLKDVILALLFVATLGTLLDVITRRCLHVMIYGAALWWGIATFRAYAALSLAAGLAVYILALLPRRFALWCGVGLLLVMIIATYTESGGSYYRQLWFSLAQLVPETVATPKDAVKHVALALPRLFLAPYAWVKARGELPMYELYPGMWWLYLVVYPFAAAGFVRAMRENLLATTLPLVAWALSAYILMISYGGDAPRQRLYLDAVMCVFAGLGYGSRRTQSIMAMWLWVLWAYMSAHLLSVGWRY